MSGEHQETCKFEKYGICTKREQCPNFHPIENCSNDNRSTVKCRKRHPQPCRYFGTQSGCKFGSSCKFDHHRQMFLQSKFKEMESNQEKLIKEKKLQDQQILVLNEKIVSLENNLLSFMKDKLVSTENEVKMQNEPERVKDLEKKVDECLDMIVYNNFEIRLGDVENRLHEINNINSQDQVNERSYKAHEMNKDTSACHDATKEP